MGFFDGRATFLRFRVDGPAPRQFGEEHLTALGLYEAGRASASPAGTHEYGWTAGEHVLDTDFALEKNVVGDILAFALRVVVDQPPADLLKAYYAVELKGLSAHNPSGRPSARQKREAKENARDRLEQEGKDGRFRKRKVVPVLWDAASNEVLYGTTSAADIDMLVTLFARTFGPVLECVTAGRRAARLAALNDPTRDVEGCRLSEFVPGVTPGEAGWIADDSSRDFLGNEFLLWLWFNSEGEADTVTVADKSEVTYMIARTLALDCPRGHTGSDGFRHEGPSRLPEAKRAIQTGKLPRSLGLTLVRHAYQYEITLDAETLGVRAAKFPPPPEDVKDGRAKLEERADRLRHLIETLDLLYDAFGRARFGGRWAVTLPRMQKWLARVLA